MDLPEDDITVIEYKYVHMAFVIIPLNGEAAITTTRPMGGDGIFSL